MRFTKNSFILDKIKKGLPVKWNILFLFLSFVVLACGKEKNDSVVNSADTVGQIDGWTLVWQDEFDAAKIDLSKWTHEVNAQGGGNNELQYYTDRPENSYLEDGSLVIEARKEQYTDPEGTRSYTSARMVSRGKGDWKYGRFDIRAKLPYGKGLWPAIWMMPSESVYGGWAASGEIDIMEMLGHETNKVYGTLHYGGTWPDNVHTGTDYVLPSGDFVNSFHVFSLQWEPGEIRWYVDGIQYQTQKEWHTKNGIFPAPFDQDFFMILNVAVGGNWPGDPDHTTLFPQRMFVDYVRVYKKD